MTARQQFVSEWRSINSEAHDPSAVVLDHGRACDLIVASQTDPTWEGSRHLDFPERLAIESGRPVLVVPASGRFPGMPQRIMIAWNNRREAARAVFDALPLLQAGEAVTLLTVDDAKGRTGALPDTEIAACLARHGIRLTASRVAAEEWTVGEEIRVRAADMRADLVVMGAYGHSRFREYAFGGVTRHMSGNMTIPILLSH
jgi:nucleotide-binding universal stress UspA family protein